MISEKSKLILLLDDIGLPYKVQNYVLEFFSAEDVFALKIDEAHAKKVLGEENYNKLKNAILDKNIEKTISKLEKYGVKAVTIADDEYPEKLKNISSPPLVLYFKGDVSLLKEKSVAIVGTRKPTFYGREVTRMFARSLSESGLVIVSGLAYGLDMEAALATLSAKGKTIAVLGGGLDKIYPSQNTNLSEEIVASGGLLVSLYAPLRRPTKYSFSQRNRIISALSEGTIVVEAGEDSGTLITANYALEQKRELFIIPANITSSASRGSNLMIQMYPNTFTFSPEHVLKVLKIEKKPTIKIEKKEEGGEVEKLILKILYEGEQDVDTLQEKTNLDSKLLIRKLTTLEISGLIKKLPNNTYTLCGK